MTEARLELHDLLVKKLIARYGQSDDNSHGALLHPVNNLIQAEVDLFMHNHSKVQAGDLSRLEGAVRSATKKAGGGARQDDQQQYTARTKSTPSLATPRSIGASTYGSAASSRAAGTMPTRRTSGNGIDKSRSRSRPRPSTAGSVASRSREQPRQQTPHQRGCGRQSPSSSNGKGKHAAAQTGDGGASVPKSIKNEWLILDTYQQLMADEKQAEEDRRAQAAIQRCKEDLDKQIQLNVDRSHEEKREAEARKLHQRKLLEQHEAHQKALKDLARKNLLEQKCARASQILENERRRERERQEKKLDEARLLAKCKHKLAEEKERQLQKRKQVAESLREMNRENIAKLAVRERQKIEDAEEDKRLMKEYQERLDRRDRRGGRGRKKGYSLFLAERTAAHNKRLERYEMIGNKWAESGAGKKQHDKDIAEERRVLAEAAIKEEADQDREIRDKKALRLNRLRCLEDNKRLMEENKARKEAEEILEVEYARQVRSEGEEHVARNLDRKKEILHEKKAYARKLKDQMRATRAALRTVQMTDTERQMNGDLLRRLQGNADLQEKIRYSKSYS
ncbi:unnamed protein product [Pylaiella littoralis]